MPKEHRYDLGRLDYMGEKSCRFALTWTLADGRFSMCGEIYSPRRRDAVMGGQCVEEVVSYFPEDAKAQRMAEIWKRWHLNDMRAGSPAQEAFLRENPIGRVADYYTIACENLRNAGLHPDRGYLHNGKPYLYGQAWLTESLPADVRTEIESWARE